MIIDIHGHYTTAPKALEEWRNRQVASLKVKEYGFVGINRPTDSLRDDRDIPAVM